MQEITRLRDGLDPKQAAILTAAFEVFLRYGFKRTSMEDIARAAGMSRPALYLHFRNKEDVFGRMTQLFYDHVCDALVAELHRPGALPDVMERALAAKASPALEAIFASPHRAEFDEYKAGAGAAEMSAGTARIAGVLAAWLEQAAAEGRVRLDAPPAATARLIAAALDGVHRTAVDYDGYARDVRSLGRMVGRALEPGAATSENARPDQAAPPRC